MRLTRGVTLIEALLALVMIAILASFAFPMLQQMTRASQAQVLQAQCEQAVAFASQQALSWHQVVTVCASEDHKRCLPTGHDWLVFIDSAKQGQIQRPQQLLTVESLHLDHGQLYLRSYPRYRAYLTFSANGESDNGTIWYCPSHTPHPAWALSLNKTGETHPLYPDKQGIIRDSHGKVLLCT